MKKLQTTTLHSSGHRSSKATDGMQYQCVKHGGMTKQKYGRHITNTCSWVQENTTTNTGVGILLNKKWRQRIIDTEYINERAITATIVVNRQRIKLMSAYFTHSGYADPSHRKMYKTIEKHTTNYKRYILFIGRRLSMHNWDLDTEVDVLVWEGTHSTREMKEENG